MHVTIALRAGGGPQRGFGHIRRCLTLAEAISTQAGRAVVILNDRDAAVRAGLTAAVEIVVVGDSEIRDLDETLLQVSRVGAAVLVVDSYDVSLSALERVPLPLGLIVDAPPSLALPAALVTSAVSSQGTDWPVRPGGRAMLGPRYALVRERFSVPARSIKRHVSRVLVTTGGTDLGGWVTRLVPAVREAVRDATVDVIVGPYFASESVQTLETLSTACPSIVLHRNVGDVRDLMLGADLAVTGGGQTIFELAATGTPAVAVCLADNQSANLISLQAVGSLVYAGRIDDLDIVSLIGEALMQLSSSWERREQMSRAGRAAVDGKGPTRVAEALLQLGRSHAAV